eukprot:12210763-Heterocapsa_arctica.AAC.1
MQAFSRPAALPGLKQHFPAPRFWGTPTRDSPPPRGRIECRTLPPGGLQPPPPAGGPESGR